MPKTQNINTGIQKYIQADIQKHIHFVLIWWTWSERIWNLLGLVNRTKVGERLRNGSLPVSVFAGIEKLERKW